MDQDVALKLVDTLAELPEPLSPSQAADRMREAGGLDDPMAVIQAIISLERTRSSHSWDVVELSEAVAAAKELKLEPDDQARFARVFASFLSLSNLRHTAKASTLATAHEHLVHSTRVLTDIRPIFDDFADQPVGGLVVHQLELGVWTARGAEQLYFALDEEQLTKLREDIARGLSKGASVKKFLSNTGLPVHDLSEDD